MHEGCRDDRFFSFRFGVGAGGCMQGRVAYIVTIGVGVGGWRLSALAV
jgi:hypothetical protein